ncbi:MAG: sigma 54-interacting transcriptional regulator [Acidobacteria bacterium]|nr:sigma 54-interacting transcriptional regulator [Acidobacteriota bacterium]
MLRILFFCTGNGGRSLMAAAFARKLAPAGLEIVCAGDISQDPHPMAGRVMLEAGENLDSSGVKDIKRIQYQPFDVVVTLCNQANEICPTFPGSPARIHWPLPDPSKADPDRGAVHDAFKIVRDEIRQRVESLFQHGFLRALEQLRRTLGSILDNLTDGVLAHDFERRIFFFNQAAQKITGFDFSEVVGRDCHDVFQPRFCGGNCSFCEYPGNPADSKLRYLRTFINKNGERRDLEMSVVTIKTPQNEQTGALVIFRDVTELVHLRNRLESSRGFCGMVGRHASMQEVYDSIRELADVNLPILIQGESGTGKEMVATALHQLSRRCAGPFVPVNCGALPEGTLESELFGHVKGAFTGAIHDRKGRFALAEGGTIFLDEIGEITPATQVKLLRVIQEKTFMPVGGEKNVRADVRVLCATNRDLKLLTRQGRFRTDLYYRLAVMPLHLPPLRDRGNDVALLADFFLDKYSSDTGKSVKEIAPDALLLLMHYNWPGNVRELSNAIQYAMVKCRTETLEPEHLPPEIREYSLKAVASRAGRPPKLDLETVRDALHTTGGNRAEASRLLGVSRTTLYRFLENHEVSQNTDV